MTKCGQKITQKKKGNKKDLFIIFFHFDLYLFKTQEQEGAQQNETKKLSDKMK